MVINWKKRTAITDNILEVKNIKNFQTKYQTMGNALKLIYD